MKMLLLLAGAYANGGAFFASGATVEVGDDPDQISADRATDLVPAYATELDENGEPVDADAAPAKGKKTVPDQPAQ